MGDFNFNFDAIDKILKELKTPPEIPKKTDAEKKAEWAHYSPYLPYSPDNSLPSPNSGLSLLKSSDKVLPSPVPPILEAGKWLNVIKHPCEVLILGGRGKGKSALGQRILEYHRWGTAKLYVVGLPGEARKLLPDWIGMEASMDDVPVNSIVLVDEAYIPYHARAGTTVGAKAMSRAINLSRQRGQSHIFVTQEARQIDKNIVSSVDVVVFKDPSMLQLKFDRQELRDLAKQAKQAFNTVSGDKRNWAFVCDLNSGFAELIETSLPTFWSEKLSHVFAAGGETITRVPKKALLSERIEKAKEFAKQGLSQGEISKMMGVSRPTVGNWLKDYPYKR